MNLPESVLMKNQVKYYPFRINTNQVGIVDLRYDDQYGNSYNTFSITGTVINLKPAIVGAWGNYLIESLQDDCKEHYPVFYYNDFVNGLPDRYIDSCGCIHDVIAKYTPFNNLIKWHLCSSDGPMHYIANTLYHASQVELYDYFVELHDPLLGRDKYGIMLGLFTPEKIEVIKERYKDFDIRVEKTPRCCNHSVDLDAARSSAIWSDATLEQVSNEELLKARLPALMQEFKQVIEGLGFIY